MKKIDLGQSISILANVGVIAGIIFLAVEVQQNTELLTAQIQAYRFEMLRGFSQGIQGNTDLAGAMAKLENGETLTGPEEMLVRVTALNVFRSWQWQYTEAREGRLSEENLRSSMLLWRAAVRGEGIVRWPVGAYWSSMKDQLPPDFVQFVEENVVNWC